VKKCTLCNVDDVVEKYHNKCQRCNRAYLFGREQAVAKARAMIIDVQKGAWYSEQERIIELIESWNFPVKQGVYTVDDSVKNLIALIKGEK
jgi:hypothetical protein